MTYFGQKVLRAKAEELKEITEDTRRLVEEMIETMWANDGMGLAAPQVGVPLRLFITAVPSGEDDEEEVTPKVYINPVLSEPTEDHWVAEEGCLSIPRVRGEVERPVGIRVRALDLNGREFEEVLEGWEARCVMHENDHLNGVLFPDRMTPQARRSIEAQLKSLKKKHKD